MPKMTAKDTNYTSGEEPTNWLTYTLENYLAFMPYQLGLLVTLIILYFPVLIGLILFYIGGIYTNVYKIIRNLPDDPDCKLWRKHQLLHAFVLCKLGKLLHGYEVCGMDNIPKGPALLILYHGSMPLDYYLFTSTFLRMTGRLCRVVADRFFFLLPASSSLLQCLKSSSPDTHILDGWWHHSLKLFPTAACEEHCERVAKQKFLSLDNKLQ